MLLCMAVFVSAKCAIVTKKKNLKNVDAIVTFGYMINVFCLFVTMVYFKKIFFPVT